MLRPYRPLLGPLLILLATGILAGWTFVHVMYDGSYTSVTLIEAANYAAQTVTTVGYGNWESPAKKPVAPMSNTEDRVLKMRFWSVFYMIAGATAYAVFTGVIVSVMMNESQA